MPMWAEQGLGKKQPDNPTLPSVHPRACRVGAEGEIIGLRVVWSRKFEEPISLVDGRKLNTVRDAAYYIIGLPPEAVSLPHWQLAMEALSQVSESSPTTQARLAFLKALESDAPHLFRGDARL